LLLLTDTGGSCTFETVPPEVKRHNFIPCLKVTQTRSRKEGAGERIWRRSGKSGTGTNRKKWNKIYDGNKSMGVRVENAR